MKTNRKLRFQLFVQNSFFVVLFLVFIFLIGFLSHEYHASRDVTQGSRNTLTEGSVNVLKQMNGPITITAYVTKDESYRKFIHKFVERYQRVKPDIKLEFVNPAEEPKATQDAGVRSEIELVVEFNKRTEHIVPPQAFIEQEMTNLMVRLSRTNQNAIMFLDGHGERSLIGVKNHDIGDFGKHLEKKGFKLANPDLLIAQAVPHNGAMLVIASPQVDVTEIEVKKIKDYLDAGGNLFWLIDDEKNLHGLQPVAEYLGLELTPGMVVDLSAKQYGADAKIAFANQYGVHAITKNFMLRTLFPEARMLTAAGTYDNGWQVSNIVEVAPNGWLETGEINDKVSFDNKKDIPGPINIAVAMERKYGEKGQRVVVVGNGNFLSNTFLGNGGNLDLGLNMVNWLAGDDRLITIQPKPLKDVNVIIPSEGWSNLLAQSVFLGFSRILPVVLVIIGVVIWWRRRKA
ncbi:GldG family protein [Methylobacillus caricis]|uniref:GldG family protein n=1 Tax=Methylobacillus caricis TaxID=1971611 RepID=UPI001D00122E|nr:GldG family protein [Methylobacillus caricis]MCB5186802.1 GldG family protein [Methylobacillus caricis]